jgi:hypothetical protein
MTSYPDPYLPPAGENRTIWETAAGDYLLVETVSADCSSIVLNDPRLRDAFDEVGGLYFAIRPVDVFGVGTGVYGGSLFSDYPSVILGDMVTPERIQVAYDTVSQINFHLGEKAGTTFVMPSGVTDGLHRLSMEKTVRRAFYAMLPSLQGKQSDNLFANIWTLIEGGDFAPFSNVRPGEVLYHKRYNVLADTSPTAQAWTDVDLSSYVPTVTPPAEALLNVRSKRAGAAEVMIRPNGTSYTTAQAWVVGRVGSGDVWDSTIFWCPIGSDGKIEYYFDNSSPEALYIDVLGFRAHPEVS